MTDEEAYRVVPGEQLIVTWFVDKPYLSPRGKHDLCKGDILEVSVPPRIIIFGSPYIRFKVFKYYSFGHIAPDRVEKYTPGTAPELKVCTCNMWTTGCVCGVFEEEQRAKVGDNNDHRV